MGRPKSFLIWILCINCLMHDTLAQLYPSANQDKLIKRLNGLVSPFVTDAQYRLASNIVTHSAIMAVPYATIVTNISSTLMSSLTSAQMSTIGGMAFPLLLAIGNPAPAIANLQLVMGNNCKAFYGQLLQYAATLKAQGVQNKGIAKNLNRITNSFATFKRVKTIMTRVSLKFQPTSWKKLVGVLDGRTVIVRLKKYGFTP